MAKKIKDLMIKEVPFAGTKLMCVKDPNSEEIFVGINWILEGLGFDETRIRYQRERCGAVLR